MPRKPYPRGGRLPGSIKNPVSVSLLLLLCTPALSSAAAPQVAVEALGADLALFGPANSRLSAHDIGAALATCDLNTDGTPDLLMGAPGFGGPGAAYVAYGGAIAPGTTRDLTTQADVAIQGITEASFTGFAVACWDVNGDGSNDILIGAPFASHGDPLVREGGVYVLYGGQLFPAVIDLAATSPNVTFLGKRTTGDGGAYPDSLVISLA